MENGFEAPRAISPIEAPTGASPIEVPERRKNWREVLNEEERRKPKPRAGDKAGYIDPKKLGNQDTQKKNPYSWQVGMD